MKIRPIFSVLLLEGSKKQEVVELRGFSKGKIAHQKPIFHAKIEYKYKNDRLWRPWRIVVEESGKWNPYPPEDHIQNIFLKARFLFLDSSMNERLKRGIVEFAKSFGVKKDFTEVILCPLCEFQNRTTILLKNQVYNVSTLTVCRVCAIQELSHELEQKKIDIMASPGFRTYALKMLDRFRDIKDVIFVLINGEKAFGDKTLIKRIEVKDDGRVEVRPMAVSKIKSLPPIVRNFLSKQKINQLLPVQVEAIRNGLFDNNNLLVIADTSAGKTLIAEMAGLNAVARKKKFIFAVPLVALANTKYEEFKRKYGSTSPFKYNVGLRVGRARIFNSVKERKQFYKDRYLLGDSDILVATYEGLDILMRAKISDFADVGCIVVDEIQSLEDKERGPTLDCLIAKLRHYFKNTQFLALSATVGNPLEFSEEMNLKLVSVKHRPVPLEEHILISRSEEEKLRQIIKLAKDELRVKSKKGYSGQTIVFTNSRRKASEFAEGVRGTFPRAQAYHSGLSYSARKQIEKDFSSGKCPLVFATFALGAGVDFPASQVIFESLMMGKDVLSPNMFNQMAGRAGRLGKHDRGRVVLLCSAEQISSLDTKTEVEIGFSLINSELTPIEPLYDRDSCCEQIISICSLKSKMLPIKARQIYNTMLGTSNYDFRELTNYLIKEKFLQLIPINGKKYLKLTKLGKAVVLSFFKPSQTKEILFKLDHGISPLKIAIALEPNQNIYISRKLHSYLERTYNMRFSTRLFSGPVLDVMSSTLVVGNEDVPLNKWCLTVFAKWTQNFFNCSHKENPFCECGQLEIGRYIVNKRLKGFSPVQISNDMKFFELQVYPGDIYSFLNAIVHNLEGIYRIVRATGKKELSKNIKELYLRIESPFPLDYKKEK